MPAGVVEGPPDEVALFPEGVHGEAQAVTVEQPGLGPGGVAALDAVGDGLHLQHLALAPQVDVLDRGAQQVLVAAVVADVGRAPERAFLLDGHQEGDAPFGVLLGVQVDEGEVAAILEAIPDAVEGLEGERVAGFQADDAVDERAVGPRVALDHDLVEHGVLGRGGQRGGQHEQGEAEQKRATHGIPPGKR